MKALLGFNPWLKMWVKPKTTIRKVVDYNPNFRLFFLSAIYGFVSLLSSSQSFALGTTFHFFLVLFLSIIIAPLWGYIVFSVSSFFIFFTGRWLQGKAKYKEVRSAIAWSNAPMIVNVVLWILLLFIFREDILRDFPATFVFSKAQRVFLFLILLCQLVVSVWIIVLYINALSEVQKFSIGKAILNILIAIVIFVAVFFAIALIYFLIMRGFLLR
ncbi:MAG: hypothetical protein KR126chlam4_00769 [Candidatus Anoxychlamydiales bacterium]|uniref:Yip1 domain-containing protein n=1 Tax=marine sediment metagenome TaxID=412755 RepID=A0A0F9D1H6_9ZZZZ|nr:hypothetical protein [Candidatus Anoxychlamydiales bacterium]HEU63929.1 hypothetical protein [Chlamydiota bacterium]